MITFVILCGNLAARKVAISKTPNLDALRQKRTTLVEKLNATDKQSKEYEEITQELKNLNKKFEDVDKDPNVKKLWNQKIKLLKDKMAEIKKIQNLSEFREVKEQSKSEAEQLIKEIIQTDPKIKAKIDQSKELADKVKAIAKEKYPEEFKK